jgi:hypothetical protein
LQGRCLHTERYKHRINTHNTDIHLLSGTRTHDPSVRTGEEGSCLRPRGQCDRQACSLALRKIMQIDKNPQFHFVHVILLIATNELFNKLLYIVVNCFQQCVMYFETYGLKKKERFMNDAHCTENAEQNLSRSLAQEQNISIEALCCISE